MKNHEAASQDICNVLQKLITFGLLRLTTSSYNFELSFFEMCWGVFSYVKSDNVHVHYQHQFRTPYLIGVLRRSEKKSIKLICMNMYTINYHFEIFGCVFIKMSQFPLYCLLGQCIHIVALVYSEEENSFKLIHIYIFVCCYLSLWY